jgi:ATP-dependent helicase/nuclease subunit B
VPDAGPWLNRPMRENFGLQQPERDIGTTAHDFCQALGHQQVIITWPRKIGGKPAMPSRWIVRLRIVLQALGLKSEEQLNDKLSTLVSTLDKPEAFRPHAKPRPTPPVQLRPTSFSVTGVETLVRDSYAVYAKRILKLEPLPNLNEEIGASLRGSLIHEALHFWGAAGRAASQEQSLAILLERGAAVFSPYMHLPEVARFWWPRFRRMATDFVERDIELRAETLTTFTEVGARLEFIVGDVKHALTARADRIDVQSGRSINIYDYKSGGVPGIKEVQSGFAPQLPLEAALARRGAFGPELPTQVDDAIYLKVGGTAKGVEPRSVAPKDAPMDGLAELHFSGLRDLLAQYLKPGTEYLPRHNLQRETSRSDYDHLSRYGEWRQLDGSEP